MLKKIDTKDANSYKYAIISLEEGDILLELFSNETPITVCNFAQLANAGFYDGLSFHRVIKDFVAQGGCPHGSGTGGPGYSIKCECDGQKHKHIRGALSMAHAGRDTGGSQFFLVLEAQPHLDGVHTVFGSIDIKDDESLKQMDAIKANTKIKKIQIFESLQAAKAKLKTPKKTSQKPASKDTKPAKKTASKKNNTAKGIKTTKKKK